MSCGIYKLNFNGTDKVYIGQSDNIEYRFKKHIQSLKNGKANYKMLEAFNRYGLPTLEILVECLKEELNTFEKEAFEIFDSIKNGFNIASEPDIHLSGELNPASKYSNEDIALVFELLLDEYNSYKSISGETGVSISTIRHIANLESHTWLKEVYPDKYKILEDLRGFKRQSACNSSKVRGKNLPNIISPEGVAYTIDNISQFAREHNLDPSSLRKVLVGEARYKTHKGWHL